jgi:8-oxo-dGTP pyrophosphatase MutT (NUDIX family)
MSAFIDKLALFSLSDHKVLAVRSHDKSLFYMPGGKREVGETDQQALIREIDEELAVTLMPQTIHYATTLEAQADGKPEGTLVRLTCYFAEFEGKSTAASEIEELRYLNITDLSVCSKDAVLALNWLRLNQYID